MVKEHIKLRFANETDLKAVHMVAEKQGYTLEQFVHVLLHKATLDYLEARRADAGHVTEASEG